MMTVSPSAPSERMALPVRPACRAAPRVGAPLGRQPLLLEGLTALPQQAGHGEALAFASMGFPGLSLDLAHERGVVQTKQAERHLDELSLAYLRNDSARGALPPEQLSVLDDLVRQAEQHHVRGVRIELSGPVGLGLQFVDEHERPLAYDAPLREALAQYLALRSLWLQQQINLKLGSTLICFDEPFLEALASPFCPLDWEEGGAMLARALVELPAPRGLCVAGEPDWAALLALPVDCVFFDAYAQSATLIQAAPAVADYLDRGGLLGWGIVPADAQILAHERVETLAHRFMSSVEYLAAAGELAVEKVLSNALISTSSRLGHLPPDVASYAANCCTDVAAWLRQHYHLEEK
ncbi:hypothetical protein [Candidatus Viridilinea mediisalina]|uniref:Methionine synthase n=1 Tax=Candidatus Viridilinea mediisalina TaxID=2024553 RepID=A0A2A6RKZ8_9CHLR|nr:hypothetical protein [Candidatus Viridilinea mediisalina]PDW03548.1 hypothetical protein CJ255_08255 [Candidatus Viridilinea mediisalina]